MKKNKIRLYLFTTIALSSIVLLLACFSYANNFNVPTTSITITLNKSNAEGDWKDYINVKSVANDEIIATTEDGITVSGQAYLFQNYVVEAGIKHTNGRTIPLRTKTIKVRNANQAFEIKMPQAFVDFKVSLKEGKSSSFNEDYCIKLEEVDATNTYEKCGSREQTIRMLKGIYKAFISSNHILQNITRTAYVFKDKETAFTVQKKGTASVTIKFEEPLLAHTNISFIGAESKDFMLPPGTSQETYTLVNGVTKITVSFGNWEKTLPNGKRVMQGGYEYSREYNLKNGEARLIKLNQKVDYSRLASKYGETEKIEVCATGTGKKNIAVFSMLSESTGKSIGIDNVSQWEGYIESMGSCITTPELPKGRYRVQIKNGETGQIANKYVNTQITGQNTVSHQGTYLSGQPVTFIAKEYISKDDAREISKFKVLVINTATGQEYKTESTENKTIQLPKGVYQATIISEDYISPLIGFSVKDMSKTVNITATKVTQWRKVIFEADLTDTQDAVTVTNAEMKLLLYDDAGEVLLNIAGVENREKKMIITAEIPANKTFLSELRLKCKAAPVTTFDYVYRMKIKVPTTIQHPEPPIFIYPIAITGEFVKLLAIKKDGQENEITHDLRITAESTSKIKIEGNAGNTKVFAGVENLSATTITNNKAWLPDNTFITIKGHLDQTTDANKYIAGVSIDKATNKYLHADIAIDKFEKIVISKNYKTPIQYDKGKYSEPAIVLSYAQSQTHNAHILLAGTYTINGSLGEQEYMSSEIIIESGKYKDRIYDLFKNISDSKTTEFGRLAGVPTTGEYKISGKVKIKAYKLDPNGNQVFYTNKKGELIPQKEIKTIIIPSETITVSGSTNMGFWTKKIEINTVAKTAQLQTMTEKNPDDEPTIPLPEDPSEQARITQLRRFCDQVIPGATYTIGEATWKVLRCINSSECPPAVPGCHHDWWEGGQFPDGSWRFWCGTGRSVEIIFRMNSGQKMSPNEVKAHLNTTINVDLNIETYFEVVNTTEDCQENLGGGQETRHRINPVTLKLSDVLGKTKEQLEDELEKWTQFYTRSDYNDEWGYKYSKIPYPLPPKKRLQDNPKLLPQNIYNDEKTAIITVTVQSNDGEPFAITKREIDMSQKNTNGQFKSSNIYPIVKINQQPFKWPYTKTLSSTYTAKFKVAKHERNNYLIEVEREGKVWGNGWGQNSTITINRDILKTESDGVKLILKATTEKPGGFAGKQVYATINPSQLPTARAITSGTTADAYAFWGGEIRTLEIDPSNPNSTLEHVVDKAMLNGDGEVTVIFYTSDLESFIAKTWYAQTLRSGFNIGSSSLTLERLEDTIMNNAEEPQGTFMWSHKTVTPTTEIMTLRGEIPYIGKTTTYPITKKIIVNASSTHGFYGNVLDIAVVAGVLKVAKKGAQGASKFIEIERKAADALRIMDEAAHLPNFTRHNGNFLVQKTNGVTEITNMKTGEILTELEFKSLHTKLANFLKASDKLGSIHGTVQTLVTQPFTTLALKFLGSKKGYLGDIMAFITPFGGMPPSGMPIVTMKSTEEGKFVVPNCQGCSEYMQITQWVTNYFNKPLQAVPIEYEIKVKKGKSIIVSAIAAGHIPFKTIIPVHDDTPDTINIDFVMQRDGSFGLNPFTSTENWFTQHPMFKEVFEEAMLTPELYAMSAGKSNIMEYMAGGARDLAIALYSDFKIF